jgi:hypothetical protein
VAVVLPRARVAAQTTAPRAGHRRPQEYDADARQRLASHPGARDSARCRSLMSLEMPDARPASPGYVFAIVTDQEPRFIHMTSRTLRCRSRRRPSARTKATSSRSCSPTTSPCTSRRRSSRTSASSRRADPPRRKRVAVFRCPRSCPARQLSRRLASPMGARANAQQIAWPAGDRRSACDLRAADRPRSGGAQLTGLVPPLTVLTLE